MKQHSLELIVEAAFALRRAHQAMRSSERFSRDDISTVIWHESKMWDLCLEHKETIKELQEAGQ